MPYYPPTSDNTKLPLAGGTMTGGIVSTLGAITVDTPALSATQTWNNAAVAFKGIFLNVTNTASAAASSLIDLQVAGASQFSVTTGGLLAVDSVRAQLLSTGADNHTFLSASLGMYLQGALLINWRNGSGGADTSLARNAAGVVEINNGTAGTFRDLKLRTLLAEASTTSQASIRIAHGVAPTTPVDGDLWSTTAGLFIRINGVNKTVTLT